MTLRTPFAILAAGLLAGSLSSPVDVRAQACTYYLHDDGAFDGSDPEDLLDETAPVDVLDDPMSPPDFDGDDRVGLSLKKGGELKAGEDPQKHQRWTTEELVGERCFSGTVQVHLYSASKDFKVKKEGAVSALLWDVDADGEQVLIGERNVTEDPWLVEKDWVDVVFAIVPNPNDIHPATGLPLYRLADGHRLALQVIAGDELSEGETWLSYDSTDHPSRIEIPSCDCSTVLPENPVSHDELLDVSSDQHHARYTDTEAGDAAEQRLDPRLTDLEQEVADLRTRLAVLERLLRNVSLVDLDGQLSDPQGNPEEVLRITGMNLQVVNGAGTTNSANCLGNLVVGYGETDGQERTGSHVVAIGSFHEYTSWGALLAGQRNRASAGYCVALGKQNVASGDWSTVVGGALNEAAGTNSSVGGGADRTASGVGDWAAGSLWEDN